MLFSSPSHSTNHVFVKTDHVEVQPVGRERPTDVWDRLEGTLADTEREAQAWLRHAHDRVAHPSRNVSPPPPPIWIVFHRFKIPFPSFPFLFSIFPFLNAFPPPYPLFTFFFSIPSLYPFLPSSLVELMSV